MVNDISPDNCDLGEADCKVVSKKVWRACRIARSLSGFMQKLQRGDDSHGDDSYSDLKIVCGHRKFYVHKCIVCPRSGWFAGLCRGGWKEGSEGVVTLQHIDDSDPDYTRDDPEAIASMLEFIYTGDYTICDGLKGDPQSSRAASQSTPHGPPAKMSLHAKIYSLGSKYDVPSLQDTAFHHLSGIVNIHDESDFVLALKVAFMTSAETDSRLRGFLTSLLVKHLSDLSLDNEDWEIARAIKELDMLGYGLGFDLARRASAKNRSWRRY